MTTAGAKLAVFHSRADTGERGARTIPAAGGRAVGEVVTLTNALGQQLT